MLLLGMPRLILEDLDQHSLTPTARPQTLAIALAADIALLSVGAGLARTDLDLTR